MKASGLILYTPAIIYDERNVSGKTKRRGASLRSDVTWPPRKNYVMFNTKVKVLERSIPWVDARVAILSNCMSCEQREQFSFTSPR